MPDHHFEPFLRVVDVTHDRALLAWGGFFFERPYVEMPGYQRDEPRP